MNKRGIELSVNFLVTLIIALTIFAFGITWIYKVSANANEMSDSSLDMLDEKIQNILCDTHEKSCIGTGQKTVKRGDLAVFTLKILNINKGEPFNVQVDPGNAFAPNKNPISNPQNYYKILWDPSNLDIPNNSETSLGIGIDMFDDAPSGTYTFLITITDNTGAEYDKHQIIVKVI